MIQTTDSVLGKISGRRSPRLRSLECASFYLTNSVWADVTGPDYASFVESAAVDPYGMPYYHPGYEYQTPVQWMSINNRRFMVACLHDPAWISLCEHEFEKSLSLGASGILYDEAFHHYAATHCFSAKHGHRCPATLASAICSSGGYFRNFCDSAFDPISCFLQRHRLIYSINITRFLISGFLTGISRPNDTQIPFIRS